MTQNKLCYECYDDQLYAANGLASARESEAYVIELIERKAIVECPNCKREINYGEGY